MTTLTTLNNAQFVYSRNAHKCVHQTIQKRLLPSTIAKTKANIWYLVKPIGQRTLNNMVKDMCRRGGIHGYKTNHSLHTTRATRLFRAGYDKQLRIGHRSFDRVRSYKKSSDKQHLALSEIMNGLSKPASLTANQQLQMTGTAPGVSSTELF